MKKLFLLLITVLGIGGTAYYFTQIKPVHDFVKSEGQLGQDTKNQSKKAAAAMFVISSTALNNKNNRSIDVEEYLEGLISEDESIIEYDISKDQHNWEFIFNKKARITASYDDGSKKWNFTLVDINSNAKLTGQSHSMAEVTEVYKMLADQKQSNSKFIFVEK